MSWAIVVNGVVVAIVDVNDTGNPGHELPEDMPVEPGWTFSGGVFAGPATSAPWAARQFSGHAVETYAVANEQFPQTTFPPGINVSIQQGGAKRVETPSGWDEVDTGDLVLRCRRDASVGTRQSLGVGFHQTLAVSADDPRFSGQGQGAFRAR